MPLIWKTRICGCFPGIYRDVYLQAEERVHIRDFHLDSILAEDYIPRADCRLTAELVNRGYSSTQSDRGRLADG